MLHTAPWIADAVDALLQLRVAAGWGYRRASVPFVEPTVLAALALLAQHEQNPAFTARQGGDWLAGLQQTDGSVGLSREHPRPAWPTAPAIVLWKALGGFDEAITRAKLWLLEQRGVTFAQTADAPLGHDTTIAGWPWVSETHSWVEPTAWAVIALRLAGSPTDVRVQDGLRLIRDRVIPSGGWNYGNNIAFGRALRPQPAPTGLALLALSGTPGDTTVVRSLDYLEATLETLRAPQSLAWGLLALTAWGRRPEQADDFLAEAYERVDRRGDPASQLAYLLLAAAPSATRWFGVPKTAPRVSQAKEMRQ